MYRQFMMHGQKYIKKCILFVASCATVRLPDRIWATRRTLLSKKMPKIQGDIKTPI